MIYVSKQFMGPNILGFINAIESYFNTVYAIILNYLLTLSISLANEKHTEMIGRLIGFPRPLVQAEMIDTTLFRFSISYYRDADVGFATTYGGLSDGGLLSDVLDPENIVYLDLPLYKEMLKIIAMAKAVSGRYSMLLIDNICKYIAGTESYIIEYVGPANDLAITFYNVGVYAIYIAGYVLNYLFDSVPNITVIKENI